MQDESGIGKKNSLESILNFDINNIISGSNKQE